MKENDGNGRKRKYFNLIRITRLEILILILILGKFKISIAITYLQLKNLLNCAKSIVVY